MSLRLNSTHRAALHELKCAVVDVPAEDKALAAAYEKAAPLVRALIEKNFPEKDMLILNKYEAARRDRCINIRFDVGGEEQFYFTTLYAETSNYDEEADDSFPLVPKGDCRAHWYIADARTSKAVQAWDIAHRARKKAIKDKLAMYSTLIDQSVTFEAVCAVWPEAKQLEARFISNLPVAINHDILAEITADSKRRMRKTA